MEYDLRIKSANEFSKIMANAITTPSETWIAYSAFWTPKIRYAMPHVDFNETKWNKIQSPILAQVLPKLKFNRHLPKQIVHGCTKFGGLGIMKFGDLQCYEMIKIVFAGIRQKKSWSNLMFATMVTLYQENGSQNPILKNCSK